MTLEELEALPDAVLMADQVAPFLRLNPDTIRDAAREGRLCFPSIAVGNQVRIPKMPFIRIMRGEMSLSISQSVYQK